MKKKDIENLLNQLKLEADCFTGTLSPIIKKLKSDLKPQIKLYLHVDDACVENDNFEWYLLEDIIRFNIEIENPVHNCLERECNIEGGVVSLRIDSHPNTRFTKIDKLEIIYI